MRLERLNMTTRITIPRDKYQAKFGAALADVAGGFTLQDAYGAWRDAAGYVIHEPVFIVTVHYRQSQDHAVSNAVQKIIDDLFAAGEQAVLVESISPAGRGTAIIHKE